MLYATINLLVCLRYVHSRQGSERQVSILRLFCQKKSIPFTSSTGKAEFTFVSVLSNFLFSYLCLSVEKHLSSSLGDVGIEPCFTSGDDSAPQGTFGDV